MAYMKMDYSQLDRAARSAGATASRLRTYATNIQQDVAKKSGEVTGGQNGYMSSVTSLATQKASALRKKAEKYESLKGRLQKLRTSAESADKAVASKFKSDQKGYEQNLNWFEKLLVNIHGFVNETLGESEFGRFLNNMAEGVRLIEQFKRNGLAIAKDYFIHGNGRYVINILVAVTAAVAAALAVVGTGGLVLVAAVIAAAVAIGVAVVTIIDNITAMSSSKDNPGFAKHMGSTDSLESFAKKRFFDKGVQNIFKGIDITGKVASIVTDVAGFFKTTSGGKTVYKLNKDVVKANCIEKIGFTSADNFNPEYLTTLDSKSKGASVIKKTVAKTDYYLTPSSFFKTAFGIKSNPGSNSKKWQEASTFKKITTVSKTANSYIKTGAKETQSYGKLINGKSTNKSKIKYAAKHIPGVKDGWGLIEDGGDIFGLELPF